MLKTIENAAKVTSTLTLNRHFGPCSETTSGQMVLPVKTRNIIFVRMAFPCYNKKNECFYLVYKTRKGVSSDPTLICILLASAPPSGKSINQNKMCLIYHHISSLDDVTCERKLRAVA
jgi:hypothetical protein